MVVAVLPATLEPDQASIDASPTRTWRGVVHRAQGADMAEGPFTP